MSWLKEVIGTEKAIIAMCHLDPLPGDPSYGPGSTMEQVIENARKDLLALQNGGVDPEEYSGFAFGIGLERVVMRRYNIDDLRLFYENDVRFLDQF